MSTSPSESRNEELCFRVGSGDDEYLDMIAGVEYPDEPDDDEELDEVDDGKDLYEEVVLGVDVPEQKPGNLSKVKLKHPFDSA
ncbi:hypothetical protein N7493_010616 [Penicillium malachiteum]|uniref:Uncharacterized protein n=1 Tax=Penicillium malachiteum TaxID=1324776 RepID=A0AAD6MRN0_9EURO|nr:hypothetical protein N7493_010616 [Penicillium malachiteum]